MSHDIFELIQESKYGEMNDIFSSSTILFPDRRNSPIAENLLEVDFLHGMWFLKTEYLNYFLIQVISFFFFHILSHFF